MTTIYSRRCHNAIEYGLGEPWGRGVKLVIAFDSGRVMRVKGWKTEQCVYLGCALRWMVTQ